MKKQYSTPELLVHGSLEDLTLGSALGDPGKGDEGNDGCGLGHGEAGPDVGGCS